jgi:hypothetical protein
LTLSRKLMLAALGCAAAAWLAGTPGRLAVTLVLLLFGPGYLIERALRPFPHPTPFLRPAFWLGLSLSAVALLYQWITALGLALTPPALAVLAVGCGLAVIWRFWTDDRRSTTDDRPLRLEARDLRLADNDPQQASSLKFQASSQSVVSGRWSLVLAGVLVLALWVRFYEIRDLALPAWVDSVHHALMIRVAAERGQAPLSLRPYLPVDQIPYHWGYHVFVAAAVRLSGAEIGQAMLWAGQVQNALCVLAVAALAAYLWRRPVAGVAAGIAAGLLSIWPAYYVSWGRYTQLAGLLLLPALMVAWLGLLRAPHWRRAVALALLLAGLSLIHFIVLLLALCFMAVSGAAWALGGRQDALRPRLAQGALAAALSVALAAPWLWILAARTLSPAAGRSLPLTNTGESYHALDQGLLWAGLNRWLIAGALLAALWAIWRRWRVAAEQAGWAGALFVLANPWLALYLLPAAGASLLAWAAPRRRVSAGLAGLALLLLNPWLVRLPYLGIVTNEVVVISLFVPVAVLLGGGVALLWGESTTDHRPPTTDQQATLVTFDETSSLSGRSIERSYGRWSLARGALAASMLTLSLWGAWNLRDVVNPSTVLATQADVEAIGWVKEHTPPDARFLINATTWLNTGRGVDGGWWLLPLAGRWTSTPPVIYDFGPRDYIRQVRADTRLVSQFAPGQEQQIYDLIDRERITYVYLGPNSRPLTPDAFPASAGFAKVYERDGVTILAVHRP